MKVLIFLLLLSIYQPFCGSVGDSTLYFEVWRKLWRFSDASLVSGWFYNKFYSCVGTPIHRNLILTSANCLQRFPLDKDDVIYLYGNYNQTKIIQETESSPLIRFLTDLELNPVDIPMAFSVQDVVTFDSTPEISSDSALIVLSNEIFLKNNLQLVEVINKENYRDFDYNSCVVSSRNRLESSDNLKVNCTLNFTSNSLECQPLEGQKVPIAMTSGSPVFCPINNTEDFFQVGFVSHCVREQNPDTRRYFFTPKYISVADISNFEDFVAFTENPIAKWHEMEELEPGDFDLSVKFISKQSSFDYQIFNKTGHLAVNDSHIVFNSLDSEEK